MKKSNLKAISFFLLIAMVVSLLSVNIFAEPITYDASVNGDGSLTAVYDSETSTLTFSGSGDMKDWTSYSSVPWYGNRNNITSIVFAEGSNITSIGDYAFYSFTKLSNITLPNTITDIGKMSFEKNSKLTQITIPGSVKVLGGRAFYGCSILSDIELEEGLETIGANVFDGCTSITSLVIPEGVSTLDEYAIYNMANLTSLTLPSTLTSIGKYGLCLLPKLNSLTFEGYGYTQDTYSLGNYNNTSGFIGSSATNKTAQINKKNVYLIDTLIAKGWSVTTVGDEPTDEEKYSSYPSGFVYEIGASDPNNITAYANVYSGKLELIGAGATKDIASGSYSPFSAVATKITEISFSDEITHLGNRLFVGNSNYFTNVKSISLPSSLETIGSSTFYKMGLESIMIPSSVISIGNDAFNQTSLKNIYFENDSSLKTVGSNAFSYCSNLTSVILPEGTERIEANAFSTNTALEYIELPSTIQYIGDRCFSGSTAVSNFILKSEDLTFDAQLFMQYNASASTAMGYKASDKKATISAKQVYLVDALTGLGYTVSTIGEEPTEEEKWESYPDDYVIEIGAEDPSNVTAYINKYAGTMHLVGSGATTDFANTSNNKFGMKLDYVHELYIDEGITHLGDRLFKYYAGSIYEAELSNVKTVVLPSTLESIGAGTFNSSGLESIVIPASVTSIGDSAFANSSSLSLITNLSENDQTIGTSAFPMTNPSVYLYSTNTSMIEATQDTGSETEVIFLDEPATSGVLENGIKWTYDTETHIITFDTSEATSTELPSYSAGSQPWYGASYAYGGVLGYDFGGVSSFGSGALGGLLYGSSSLTVYGSNNLSSAVGSALGSGYSVSYGGSSSTGGSTGGDIGGGSTGDNTTQDPSTDTSETGIWIYVNDEEVDFPDVQPRVWFGEVYAPLRFINQDLGATVLWNNDTRTATIQRTTDSGKKVEIKLTVGSSSMVVNGKEYTSEEIGMDATVLIEDGRLLLPGRAIVKAWDDVYFKKVYTATAYRDYYYYEDDGLGEEKLEDIQEIENFTETEVIITPDSEQEVLSNYGDTKILVNAESTFFYTSTPILIPIYVDKTGDATIPTDLYIENKCAWGPVVVKNIEFIKANGWEVKAFDTFDFKNTLADSKYIGLTINEVVVEENGSVDMNESLSSSILYKSKKQLTFDAKIPAQRSVLKEICAGIVFTVDFDKIVE